jgi:hypothetical protein
MNPQKAQNIAVTGYYGMTLPRQMKRTLTLLIVAVMAFAIGIGGTYLVMRQSKPSNDGWIAVTVTNFPMGYALDYPIGISPTPNVKGLSGKVKFLTRDNGTQLGYILKAPLDPIPTKSLPLKDQQQTKLTDGSMVGPPEELHLEGQFDFILKDADGFELQRISALQLNLAAGDQNEKQGIADGTIPSSVQERTKRVEVSILIKNCYPCNK